MKWEADGQSVEDEHGIMIADCWSDEIAREIAHTHNERERVRAEVERLRDEQAHLFDDGIPPGGKSHWSYQQAQGAKRALDEVLKIIDGEVAE